MVFYHHIFDSVLKKIKKEIKDHSLQPVKVNKKEHKIKVKERRRKKDE